MTTERRTAVPPTPGSFYLKMAAIGAGFFGVTLVWSVYNTYMPLLLGAFIDSRTLRGALMGLDNALAVTLLPFVGAWSDRVRSPWGQRLPFIAVGMPAAALLFVLLGAQRSLWLLLALDLLFLCAMTVFRAPVIALMPDHAPPERRATANGVINLMGGLGGLLAFFILAPLYDLSARLPFYAAAGILLLTFFALLAAVDRAPPYAAPRVGGGEEIGRIGSDLRDLWRLGRERRPLLVLGTIALYFIGFSGLEAQFSTYATESLGLSGGRAGLLLGFFSLAFVACALPAGLLGSRFGKLRVMRAGLLALPVLFLLTPLLPTALPLLLLLIGACWALVNVQAYPLVADLGGAERIGLYTGLYYLFSVGAGVVGPGLLGLTMDLFGAPALFYASAGAFVLASVCLTRAKLS